MRSLRTYNSLGTRNALRTLRTNGARYPLRTNRSRWPGFTLRSLGSRRAACRSLRSFSSLESSCSLSSGNTLGPLYSLESLCSLWPLRSCSTNDCGSSNIHFWWRTGYFYNLLNNLSAMFFSFSFRRKYSGDFFLMTLFIVWTTQCVHLPIKIVQCTHLINFRHGPITSFY